MIQTLKVYILVAMMAVLMLACGKGTPSPPPPPVIEQGELQRDQTEKTEIEEIYLHFGDTGIRGDEPGLKAFTPEQQKALRNLSIGILAFVERTRAVNAETELSIRATLVMLDRYVAVTEGYLNKYGGNGRTVRMGDGLHEYKITNEGTMRDQVKNVREQLRPGVEHLLSYKTSP